MLFDDLLLTFPSRRGGKHSPLLSGYSPGPLLASSLSPRRSFHFSWRQIGAVNFLLMEGTKRGRSTDPYNYLSLSNGTLMMQLHVSQMERDDVITRQPDGT